VKADVAVLGGGPSGLTAALLAARRGLRVVLVGADEEEGPRHRRLEVVPAQMLTLLIELGVNPVRAGWTGSLDERQVAWWSRAPERRATRRAALLMRPILDIALREAARSCSRIVRLARGLRPPRRVRQLWQGEGWRAERLVDATGRRALTTSRRARFPGVARTWCGVGGAKASPLFAIAALPQGYAYRIRGGGTDDLGLVSWSRQGVATLEEALRQLQDESCAWLLSRFDPTGSHPAATVAAGIQFALDEAGVSSVRIGDAAFARDPLASQGTFAGLVDACCAVDTLGRRTWLLDVRERVVREGRAHVEALSRLLREGYFRREPEWQELACRLARLRGDMGLSRAGTALPRFE
jgi:flavin-dependent dehydrogenase